MTTPSRFERLWLPLVFLLSGVSGLVYQVVWMRMLIRVFGITIYATSTVVATFMGGLALGSWIAGRTVASRRPTLRTYARIEFGIAASALLATAAMKVLPEAYAALYPGSLPQMGEVNAAGGLPPGAPRLLR
jgi:spermidine synthase